MAHSTGMATITFGLVAIPVRTYAATSSQSVGFATVHAGCSTRLKQRLYCPVCGDCDASEHRKSLQMSDGSTVTFEPDELAALESPRANTIEVAEFVALDGVDPVYLDRASYLGPVAGSDKAYAVLVRAMEASDVVAVARYHARGRTHLVMLRPLRGRIVLHYLHFGAEVREIDAVEVLDAVIPEREQALAGQLVEAMRAKRFDARQYRDEHADRVRAAAEAKSSGAVQPPAIGGGAQIIDLMEALRSSLRLGAAGGAGG